MPLYEFLVVLAEPYAMAPSSAGPTRRVSSRQAPGPPATYTTRWDSPVDPLGHHSAVRAARRVGRLDHHPAPALGPVAGLDDAVVGQVEDRARSITLRARRLVHKIGRAHV